MILVLANFGGEAGHEFVFLVGVHPQNDTIYAFDGGRQTMFIYDTNGRLLERYSHGCLCR